MKKKISYSFHKSKTGQGVKNLAHASKVSDHNIRNEKNPKSNDTHYPDQAKFNEILIGSDDIKKDIQDAYEEYFEEAYKEWNDNQMNKNRIKANPTYLEKMNKSKKDIANEIIIGFGEKNDWLNCVNNWQNKEILKDAIRELSKENIEAFKKEYPNEKIINAVIHFDESTPHLHLISISVHESNLGPKVQHLPSRSFTPNEYKTEPRLEDGKQKFTSRGKPCTQRVTDKDGNYIVTKEGTLAKGQTNMRNQLNDYLDNTPLPFRFKEKSKGRGHDYTVDEYKLKKIEERNQQLSEQTIELDSMLVTKQTEVEEFESDLEIKRKSKRKLDEEIKKKQNRNERYDEDAKKMINDAKAQADHYKDQARLISGNNFLLEEENETLKEYQSKLINQSKRGKFDYADLKKYGNQIAKQLGVSPAKVNQVSDAAYNDFMKTEIFSARDSQQSQQTAEPELEY